MKAVKTAIAIVITAIVIVSAFCITTFAKNYRTTDSCAGHTKECTVQTTVREEVEFETDFNYDADLELYGGTPFNPGEF